MGHKTKRMNEEAKETILFSTKAGDVVKSGISVEIDGKKYDTVAQDKNGHYFTQAYWIGGLLDPNRHENYNRSKASLTAEQVSELV